MTASTEILGDAVDPGTADEDIPVLTFSEGLPGFPDVHHFALVSLDDSGLIFDLQCLDDESVRFVVVPSVAFFPDYAPEISDTEARSLGLDGADDAAVLVVLKVGQNLWDTTANLRAPLVVNVRTQTAAQFVLDDPELALQAPLGPAPE